MDKLQETIEKIPYWHDVEKKYDLSKERIREQNFKHDIAIEKLK